MPHQKHAPLSTLLSLREKHSHITPNPLFVAPFIDATLETLFPQLSRGVSLDLAALGERANEIAKLLENLCSPVVRTNDELTLIISNFVNELPNFHHLLLEDAEAIFQGDPAAKSIDEVILAYPGFLAIAVYRIANWLQRRTIPIIPRLISEHAHKLTGIEIHPGATIGRSFVIDHGTGVVIGETTIIHDNVKMYQGVTLGALSVEKAMANIKRHPTIERDVVIYANATILGGNTVVGAGSIIGGNVWLTESIPAGSRVYHQQKGTLQPTHE